MSKCSVPNVLLSNCKQKRIHLFCNTCNLFLYFLLKFGYHAAHALSKCGWISALHKSLLKSFERNLFFPYKNFSFELTFVETCIAIDSLVRHSSNMSHLWVLFDFDVFVRDIDSFYWLRFFFVWRKENGFCFVLTPKCTNTYLGITGKINLVWSQYICIINFRIKQCS